jgi:hypothetical protein
MGKRCVDAELYPLLGHADGILRNHARQMTTYSLGMLCLEI